jgi:hypothetical protein
VSLIYLNREWTGHYTISFLNGLSEIYLKLISDKFQINHSFDANCLQKNTKIQESWKIEMVMRCIVFYSLRCIVYGVFTHYTEGYKTRYISLPFKFFSFLVFLYFSVNNLQDTSDLFEIYQILDWEIFHLNHLKNLRL